MQEYSVAVWIADHRMPFTAEELQSLGRHGTVTTPRTGRSVALTMRTWAASEERAVDAVIAVALGELGHGELVRYSVATIRPRRNRE
jgi:hypothetical protein